MDTDLVVNAYGPLFGKLGAVRVSELQRYTEDFVPALPPRSDEKTIALYQFDESEGNTVIDSSGRGNHGWIKHPVLGKASE